MPVENRRIIEIYLDVERGILVDSDGAIPGTLMSVFRGTELIVRAHLKREDIATYFTPPSGASWFFAIDNSFDPAHNDLVVTQNSMFNLSADWSDLDVANGKICWRVDTATTQLKSALGTSASEDMYAELWMTPAGVDPILLCQWQVTVKNIVSEIDADTTLTYYSSALVGQDGNDTVIYLPDGSVAHRYEG